MNPRRDAVGMFLGLAIASSAADATPPAAQPELVISNVGAPDASGVASVELRLLNGGSAQAVAALPLRIAAEVTVRGSTSSLTLERAPETPNVLNVPAGGFGKARYLLRLPRGADTGEAVLAVPGWNAQRVAFTVGHHPEPVAIADRPIAPSPSPPEAPAGEAQPSPDDVRVGNAFLPNLSAYEPIYAVYGPGTNSDALLQISFKYQMFGAPVAAGQQRSWKQGVHFAYTQRMFWDLGAKSSPFRNIDFMPELFYLAPAVSLGRGVSLGGQAGFRHESNGRSGEGSRSLNTVYLQPVASFGIGTYRLSVGPRLWLYAGGLSDNPDIKRYRGHSGLSVEIGEDDGLRIATSTRFNPQSGKGAINADLSYPVERIIGGDLNFYLVGQAFTGYGENLLDYNRRTTRVRIGLAIVR